MKKSLEGNLYAISKAILAQGLTMGEPLPPARDFSGEPLRELPPTADQRAMRTPEYWKSIPPHEEYGNIYFPYHCHHEGWNTFTVMTFDGTVAGEHLNFPSARALARALNEGEEDA